MSVMSMADITLECNGHCGGAFSTDIVCETARLGMQACADFSTDALMCADSACAEAIESLAAAYSACAADPAISYLHNEMTGICPQADCSDTAADGAAWSASLMEVDSSGLPVLPAGVTLSGDAYLDATFGVNLDGSGDFLSVDSSAHGNYGADGEFSIGMWFSRSSECRDDNDWEFLYSHQDGESTLNSTNIAMSVLCEARHESLGDGGTVITTIMMDDDRNFVQFDWGLDNEAPKTNELTSEWTHMVLTVTPTSVLAYADGTPVRFYGVHVWSEEWVLNRNLAYVRSTEAATIVSHTDPSTLRSPLSTFSNNEPISIGTGGWGLQFPGNIAGLTIHDEAVSLHTANCLFQERQIDMPGAVGVCPIPSAETGAVWFGEFLDGTTPIGAAMVGNAHVVPNYGITVDGQGDYVTITPSTSTILDYASGGEFTVSFWFTRRGECNVANRFEFLFTHVNAQLQADECDAAAIAAGVHCMSGTNPYDVQNTGVHIVLGCGGTVSGGDIIRTILVDDANTIGSFDTALDALSDGGLVADQWVHIALVVTGTSATVFLDGLPSVPLLQSSLCYYQPEELIDDCQCHESCSSCGYSFNPTGASNCISCRDGSRVTRVNSDRTGTCDGGGTSAWANASAWRTTSCPSADGSKCNAAYPDPAALGTALTTFDLASTEIVLAGQNDQWGSGGRMFFGSMAAVSLFNVPLQQPRIRCVYHYDAERVGTCTDPEDWWGNRWSASFLEGRKPDTAQLMGDASLDSKFGLQLDGEGDYVRIDGAGSFTADGTFAVSLWFFKSTECKLPEEFEYLFSTSAGRNGDTYVWNAADSGVHMYLGCAQRGEHSTVLGDVLRTWLVDEVGTQATFDYSLSAASSGGAVTDGWIHVTLSVSNSAIKLFIDGEPADSSAIGYSLGGNRDSGGNWDNSDDDNHNAACPDIGNLSPPLAGFDNSEVYREFRQYNYTVELAPGEHSFIATDTSHDGWHGGYWEVAETAGQSRRVIAGGRSAGQVAWADVISPAASQAAPPPGCVCSGTEWNGEGGPSCTSTTNGGPYCYTETGVCPDGQASGRVDSHDYSSQACAGSAAAEPVCVESACLEDGRSDSDCCALATSASCSGAYTHTTGDVCYQGATFTAYSTCCSPVTRSTLADLDSVTTFVVEPPPNTALAYGPPCPTPSPAPTPGYHDDDVFNQTITLAAGEYYMHTNRDWDSSYWAVVDSASGEVLAGGAGHPAIGAVNSVETVAITQAVTAVITIRTFHRSGIQWMLNTEPPLDGDADGPAFRRPCTTELEVSIITHTDADEIGWMIDDGMRYMGPRSSAVVLGARNDVARMADRPEYWTYLGGSIAGVYLWSRALENDQAACLFRRGESRIGVCKSPDNMRGSHFFASFTEDTTVPDNVVLNGAAYVDEFGGGVRLGGKDDSISILTSDYSSGGAFTIAFWVSRGLQLQPLWRIPTVAVG